MKTTTQVLALLLLCVVARATGLAEPEDGELPSNEPQESIKDAVATPAPPVNPEEVEHGNKLADDPETELEDQLSAADEALGPQEGEVGIRMEDEEQGSLQAENEIIQEWDDRLKHQEDVVNEEQELRNRGQKQMTDEDFNDRKQKTERLRQRLNQIRAKYQARKLRFEHGQFKSGNATLPSRTQQQQATTNSSVVHDMELEDEMWRTQPDEEEPLLTDTEVDSEPEQETFGLPDAHEVANEPEDDNLDNDPIDPELSPEEGLATETETPPLDQELEAAVNGQAAGDSSPAATSA